MSDVIPEWAAGWCAVAEALRAGTLTSYDPTALLWTEVQVLLAMISAAAAAPDQDIEEIVVFGDPLAPWDGTRWYVTSRSISSVDALSVTHPEVRYDAPWWTVEAVLRCGVHDRRRSGGLVECVVEDAAVRLATAEHWQLPSDRELVSASLRVLEQELFGVAVRLRVPGHGQVRLATDQTAASAIAERMLHRAFDAFHLDLPPSGVRDRSQWVSLNEPLLTLDVGMGTYGFEQAVHYGNVYEGQRIIQTIAQSEPLIVVGPAPAPFRGRLPGDPESRFQASWRVAEDDEHQDVPDVTVRAGMRLDAVGIFDPQLGFVVERVWSVTGSGPLGGLHRSGEIRLLGATEQVPLAASAQVAPPGQVRPGLPSW